jgi:plastocyanin
VASAGASKRTRGRIRPTASRLTIAAALIALGAGASVALAMNHGAGGGHHNGGHNQMPPDQMDPQQAYNPLTPIIEKSTHYIPKAPGTKEKMKFWYGPYVIPPGWDANRVDLEMPIASGAVLSIEPSLHMALNGEVPSHQEAHIHHAHWFSLNPGSQNDNYTFGLTDWMFGNGDEETKANFQQRSDADPKGPIYASFIGPTEPQPMIYMLHNKTSAPMLTWIALDVTFVHGTQEQLDAISDRPYHDITGILFGRTFDVPRNFKPHNDGTYETAEDDPKGVIQWTSTVEGTMIGTGSHVHPGGLGMTVENYGPADNPCPDTGDGYGGTLLLDSHVIWHHGVPFSEDYQTEVTNPARRAPIHIGDRIRISATYENGKHAWYEAMAHEGTYIDEAQPPKGRCAPYLVGPTAHQKPKVDVTAGVPTRAWGHAHTDRICGVKYGEGPCVRPEKPYEPGMSTDTVTITDFVYRPGDMSLDGKAGQPVQVPQGTSLRFINTDQLLNIRHSVTTCKWPCNGPYTANYPHGDGIWDSRTLGYDIISGGSTNPIAHTPPDLPVGKYSYYCRIHPWMRGAFEIVPN